MKERDHSGEKIPEQNLCNCIKIDPKQQDVEWSYLAQWQSLVYVVMNHHVL